MISDDVLLAIRAERKPKGVSGPEKNYIPFKREEFDQLLEQFGHPEYMPNDFKLLLQAVGEGRIVMITRKQAIELGVPGVL